MALARDKLRTYDQLLDLLADALVRELELEAKSTAATSLREIGSQADTQRESEQVADR